MRDVELYADLITSLAQWTHVQVGRLSPEELAWQPFAEGNNIAVTVWHFSRWLDVTVRLLQEKPREEEMWVTQGWAERTGYNPQGIGYQGLGVLTGYTLQEVAAVPLLGAQELLAYLDQVCQELRMSLQSLPSSDLLLQPVAEPGLSLPGQRSTATKQHLLKTVIMGSCGHVGEIEALKAMMNRAKAPT